MDFTERALLRILAMRGSAISRYITHLRNTGRTVGVACLSVGAESLLFGVAEVKAPQLVTDCLAEFLGPKNLGIRCFCSCDCRTGSREVETRILALEVPGSTLR